MDNHARTEIILGTEGLNQLQQSHVLIAGLGGVGGACAESLCRAGVGKMTIIDFDNISLSNLNRQIVALHSTIGQTKVEVLAARLLDINPQIALIPRHEFIDDKIAQQISLNNNIDFVADCIDSIRYKSSLIACCLKHERKIISAMGAGGRMDPAQVRITSLNQTHGDALARQMRKALRNLDAPLNFPVVFSNEQGVKALPHQPVEGNAGCTRAVNGTISYLPNIFGLFMAGFIINALIKGED